MHLFDDPSTGLPYSLHGNNCWSNSHQLLLLELKWMHLTGHKSRLALRQGNIWLMHNLNMTWDACYWETLEDDEKGQNRVMVRIPLHLLILLPTHLWMLTHCPEHFQQAAMHYENEKNRRQWSLISAGQNFCNNSIYVLVQNRHLFDACLLQIRRRK